MFCIEFEWAFYEAEHWKEITLKDPVFIPNVVYKNTAITFLLLHAAAELWFACANSRFTALPLVLSLLAKLRELHHHELLRKRTYAHYFLQLFAAIGYLWIGTDKLMMTYRRSVTHGDTRRHSRQYDDDLAHCGIMA